MLCSYTVAGKNKHDDVPDGMAMLSEFAQSFNRNKVEVFARYFKERETSPLFVAFIDKSL